jgi:hypothetical protein
MSKGNLRSDNAGAIMEPIFPEKRSIKKNSIGINIVISTIWDNTKYFS